MEGDSVSDLSADITDCSAGTVNQVRDVHSGGVALQSGRIDTVTINHYVALRASEQDEVTDQLAMAIRHQWEDAANDRRLLRPHSLPIRWRRCTEPVAGPVAAAGVSDDGDASFAALDRLDHTAALALAEGGRRELYRVYGGLPSGRLVIVGGPGAGKSSAAIMLLLDALRHREQAPDADRYRIPVPVMFNLAGWDPETIPVRDWLITELAADFRMFRGRKGRNRAAELFRAGRLAVFLDGLDEIPEPLRPRALQALSEQAAFRLVLLTRTRELAAAATQHVLVGAVALELLPLRPGDAAEHLLRPLREPASSAWQSVATALTGTADSPLSQALTTPLVVGLLRDVYPSTGQVDELLDTARFPEPDAIIDHLLDHAIIAAYTPRLGQPLPRYAPGTAHRTLTLIAQHLRQNTERPSARDGNRDISWWTIAAWTPGLLRTMISVLGAMVLSGLTFGLASLAVSGFRTWPIAWLSNVFWYSLNLGLPSGLAIALAFNLTIARAGTPPSAGRRARLRRLVQVCAVVAFGIGLSVAIGIAIGGWSLSVSTFGLNFAIAFGITARTRGRASLRSLNFSRDLRSARRATSAVLFSLMFGVGIGLFGTVAFLIQGAGDLTAALMFGLKGVLASVVIIAPAIWLTGAFTDVSAVESTESTGPVEAWRGDFRLWFVMGMLTGLTSGINSWLSYQEPVYGIGDEQVSPLADCLAGGVAMGLASGVILSHTWMTTMTQIWFAARYRTPLRLIRFLDDSRKRHLLRTVGPIFQFRHAIFQDHLARSMPAAIKAQQRLPARRSGERTPPA